MNGNQIPALFWMIIITGLSTMVGLIFYYLAMLLKDTRDTVQEVTKTVGKSNKLLDEADEIIGEAKKAVSMLRDTASEIHNSIIKPVRAIGSVLQTVSGFLEGLRSGAEEDSEE